MTTAVSFDANDRAVQNRDARNNVSRTEYDRLGRAVRTIDPRGAASETIYDLRGLVVETRHPDGTVVRTAYDALGRAEWVTDPFVPGTPTRGTKTVYDEQGRVVRTERSADVVLELTSSGGRTRAVFVSAANTPLSTSTTRYNELGQVIESGSTGNATVKSFYDRLGRQTRSESWDGTTLLTWTETTYDAAGRAVTSKDALGRVTRTEYDGDGRVVATHFADGTSTRVEYDDLGRKKADIDALGRRTEYGYDAVGNLTSITQKVGTTVVLTATLGYDALNRLTSRVNKDGANNILSSFSYARLANGQISGLTETVKQPDGTSITTIASYTYDALNRLVREQVDTVGTADDYTIDYTLDLVGNRLKKLTTKGSGIVERVEGTFDARDRLTEEKVYDAAVGGTLTNTLTYGYDTNGSLTSRTATTGSSLMQVWDVRGRLQSATNVQGSTTRQALYRYDPDGIRLREEVATTTGGVSTTEVRLLVVDHQSPSGYAQVIEERTESGLIVASYVYGAGLDPISVARSGQPVGLYLADGHSGVRQVVDLTAAVLAAYRYDAFGNKVATAGTFVNPIGYRGERLDPVLAEYYLRARLYDPRTGRFTAMDPYGRTYFNPAEVNRYGYAGANPVANSDPSGMFFTVNGLMSALGIQQNTRSQNQSAQMLSKKFVNKFADEVLKGLNFTEPRDHRSKRMAAAGERLWVTRLTELGYLAIPMQSTPVGSHGPDLLAIKQNGGRVHIVIGEVKALSSSKVLRALDKQLDGALQMSLQWLSSYASAIAEELVSVIIRGLKAVAPPSIKPMIKFVEAAIQRGQFDLFLLRARYYGRAQWKLRGFRLLNVGRAGNKSEPLDVWRPGRDYNDPLQELTEEWPKNDYATEKIV
ncbi:MAG TPA: RHS repeat-associated core domain-containing protein [Gemmataceae bacterium]|nr:RHS repeat-associated core domain-containing protein [Gemmataceae bacterium]